MDRILRVLRTYHPLVWILVGGTAFARTASFMSLPFLALYLSRTTGLDPFFTGTIVGAGALAGTFGGFIGGNLSDRFGRKRVMLSTLFVWAAVFWGFAMAEEAALFLILNLLNGLCRSFFEPTGQALLADVTPPDKRMRVFGFRYMAINVGAAVGPLIGAYLGMVSGKITFWITGGAYLLYAVALLITMNRFAPAAPAAPPERTRFTAALRVIRKDAALGWFILGGILGQVGYAQIESTLPLHLKTLFGENNALYPALLTLNAVTVILLQVLVTRWAEKRSLIGNLGLGCLLFGLGLGCFAIGEHWVVMMLGMFILTIGEILTFPTSSLFIDRLAPESLRGTYFGANSFRNVGFFIGPSLGGWLLGSHGGKAAFGLIALLTVCGVLFYWMGYRAWLQRKNAPEKESVSNTSLSAAKAVR